MKNTNLFRNLNLQLFAEGAGEGGTQASGATGVTATAAVSQTGVKASKNPLASVKYGKQDVQEEEAQVADVQASEVEEETQPTVDRNAEFEKLIDGEYKEQFQSKMQDVIQKRLSKNREVVENYEVIAPALEMLSQKYGIKSGDLKSLSRAIEEDDALYEAEAMTEGKSVSDVKEKHKILRENAMLKQQMRREEASKQYAVWESQANEAKKFYPNLDLRVEAKNPEFVKLLNAGVDVRSAYEVINRDKIFPAMMQQTAKTVEKKLVNKMIASGRRPSENGAGSQSTAVVKNDVSQLSKADRDEIERRLQRGEKITFG